MFSMLIGFVFGILLTKYFPKSHKVLGIKNP